MFLTVTLVCLVSQLLPKYARVTRVSDTGHQAFMPVSVQRERELCGLLNLRRTVRNVLQQKDIRSLLRLQAE